MFELLEKAKTNTVAKILSSTEFEQLLAKHGWAGLPIKFLETLARSPDVSIQTILLISPYLHYREKALRHSKHPFIAPCLLWPRLLDVWNPEQYLTPPEAWDGLVSLVTKANSSSKAKKEFEQKTLVDVSKISERDIRVCCANPKFDNRFLHIMLLNTQQKLRRIAVQYLPPSNTIAQLALKDSSPNVRKALVHNYAKNNNIMSHLLSDSKASVLLAVAKSDCSPEILDALSHSMDIYILLALIENPHISAQTIEKLSCHPYALGENSITDSNSVNAWYQGLCQNYPQINESINNKNDAAMGFLLSFNNALAAHKYTPVSIMLKLARIPLESIRISLVSNPNLPAELASALCLDPNVAVRTATLAQAELRNKISPEIQIQQLNFLAASENSQERFSAAINPNSPEYLLEQLSKDTDNWIVRAVASNPSTPEYVLRKLALHHSEDIISTLLRNEALPLDLIEPFITHPNIDSRLAVLWHPKVVDPKMLAILANDSQSAIRASLAESSKATPNILNKLASDPNEVVRYAVTANAKTTTETLEILANDGNPKIVRAAKYRLRERSK